MWNACIQTNFFLVLIPNESWLKLKPEFMFANLEPRKLHLCREMKIRNSNPQNLEN